MVSKLIPQRKRMAMGDTNCGYRRGGHVGSDKNVVSVGSTGKAINPITVIKRQNGIPGFKKGGKC